MSPITHLLASWVLAEATVKDRRNRIHITASLIAWMIYRGVTRGATVVSLLSEHADLAVVKTLRNRCSSTRR